MTASKTRTSKAAFTLETARAQVLAKVAKGGVKGATSPVTASTSAPKRSLYDQAIEALQREGSISAVTIKDKPKYFLPALAPTLAGTAAKMEQLAARRHPALTTIAAFKTALSTIEKTLAAAALESLETGKRLVKLTHGKSALYAHGDSLRAVLGIASQVPPQIRASCNSGEAIRSAYANLARLTGFPDVEIAALQRHCGIPLPALKEWLLAEFRNGRAIFGTGDWSLADEVTRAGLIEIEGRSERYLFVRLED